MATIAPLQSEIAALGRVALDDSGRRGPAGIPTIEIVHELGSDLAGTKATRFDELAPTDKPTVLKFASHVLVDSARRVNSPEYLASVRRRKSAKVTRMISSLAQKARRDDFEAFTFKVVEEVRGLLAQLTDVQSEGNTREILRQIRDTFLDGGHERYRDPKTRLLVEAIMTRLSESDDVTPEMVDRVWDELFDGGVTAPIAAVFTVEEGKV
jgi:hypothetical protein